MIRQNIALKKDFSYVEDAEYEIEWLVENMSCVTKGMPLVKISYGNSEKHEVQIINSEYDGLCYIHVTDSYVFYDEGFDSLLGFILNDIKDIESLFPCDLEEKQDEISGNKTLYWNRLGGIECLGIPLNVNVTESLYIKGIYEDGNVLFVLDFISKDISMKKGDTLSLKFDNGQVLDFTISSSPAKVFGNFKFPYEEGNHIQLFKINSSPYYSSKRRRFLREVKFVLSIKDLKLLARHLLCFWRITLNSEGGAVIDGKMQNDFFKKEVCPLIVNNMFKTLLKHLSVYNHAFSEEAIWNEVEQSANTEIQLDYCYVYLMHDEANDYYKIGMSNNPEYREGTLQSEKPTISLVASHKYPTRKFAAAIETALHNVYKDNHVRGEWYKLTDKDVKIIIEGLK